MRGLARPFGSPSPSRSWTCSLSGCSQLRVLRYLRRWLSLPLCISSTSMGRGVNGSAVTPLQRVSESLASSRESSLPNPLWVAVVTAFLVAFGFGLARVLRGYVARSTIGVQLAFLLCLLTPSTSADLGSFIAAWALGSVFSVIAALTIFPLRHNGQMRKAIAIWCRHASELPAAFGSRSDAVVIADLQRARDDLLDQSAGTVVRPGLVSRRMRALQRMQGQIEQATRTIWLIFRR